MLLLFSGSRVRVYPSQCYVLLMFWILGLCFGIWLAKSAPSIENFSLYGIVGLSPTLMGFIIICYIPVILNCIGLSTGFVLLSFIVVTLESVCRGFCGFFIYRLCGSGAWLLRLMLMFSSSVCLVIIWWNLFSYLAYGKTFRRRVSCTIAIIVLVCVMVDYYFVSPFLHRVLMYI